MSGGSPGRGEPDGSAGMVEVGGKDVTAREATAECLVRLTPVACAAGVPPAMPPSCSSDTCTSTGIVVCASFAVACV